MALRACLIENPIAFWAWLIDNLLTMILGLFGQKKNIEQAE